jgi:hypothetical protein
VSHVGNTTIIGSSVFVAGTRPRIDYEAGFAHCEVSNEIDSTSCLLPAGNGAAPGSVTTSTHRGRATQAAEGPHGHGNTDD